MCNVQASILGLEEADCDLIKNNTVVPLIADPCHNCCRCTCRNLLEETELEFLNKHDLKTPKEKEKVKQDVNVT